MSKIKTPDAAWDYLTETVGVSEETLRVVSAINGYSLETLSGVLYAVTGYRTFKQHRKSGE